MTLIENHLICQWDTSKLTHLIKVCTTLILTYLIDVSNDFWLMLYVGYMIYVIVSFNPTSIL
jgi:hypothetical protein